MKRYKVWIVILTPMMQSEIVSTLINHGMKMEALGSANKIVHDENTDNLSAYTAALRITGDFTDAGGLRDVLVKIFKEKGIKYLSLIIAGDNCGPSGWTGSTYSFEPSIPATNVGPYRTNAKGIN